MAVTSHEATVSPIESMPQITEPYVLFVSVRVEIDEQGRRWTIDQWAKDLALHLDYIDDLTLVSPAIKKTSADLVLLDEPPFDRLKFIDLPCPTSRSQAIKTFPRCVLQYWRAIGPARIVHAGFAGWPISQAWLAVPIAKLRRKFVLAIVESSFWRASAQDLPWHKRLRSYLGECLTRCCLGISDIRLFTSRAYLQELLPPKSPRAYVTPATWLNKDWIFGTKEAEAAWAAKRGPVQLLFATRLIPEKGVAVLLRAIEAVFVAGAEIQVSIIGTGPLLEECIAFTQSAVGKRCVKLLDPIPYGAPFLRAATRLRWRTRTFSFRRATSHHL